MYHRCKRVTREDFIQPWSIKFFQKGRKNKVIWTRCAICWFHSRRRRYNRRAFKRGDDYFYNAKYSTNELP